MRQHGIFTSKAGIWVHLFPLEGYAYWYLARFMRAHIKRYANAPRVQFKAGRSDDGTITGGGFLVFKDEPIVRRVPIPGPMLAAFDWQSLLEATDREFGPAGEELADWMIAYGIIRFNVWHVEQLRTQQGQYEFGDFSAQFMPRATIEVKTERYTNSAYLYVQTEEGGHRATQVRGTKGRLIRDVGLVPLELDGK